MLALNDPSNESVALPTAVEDSSMIDNDSASSDSDLSDSSSPVDRVTNRQKSLRQQQLQRAAILQAKQETARLSAEKSAKHKQFMAELRKLDQEDAVVDANERALQREFREYDLVSRMIPLGKDRFFNRYYWFDGAGGNTLLQPNGSHPHASARIFGPFRTIISWQSSLIEYSGPSSRKRSESQEIALDWQCASTSIRGRDRFERGMVILGYHRTNPVSDAMVTA